MNNFKLAFILTGMHGLFRSTFYDNLELHPATTTKSTAQALTHTFRPQIDRVGSRLAKTMHCKGL